VARPNQKKTHNSHVEFTVAKGCSNIRWWDQSGLKLFVCRLYIIDYLMGLASKNQSFGSVRTKTHLTVNLISPFRFQLLRVQPVLESLAWRDHTLEQSPARPGHWPGLAGHCVKWDQDEPLQGSAHSESWFAIKVLYSWNNFLKKHCHCQFTLQLISGMFFRQHTHSSRCSSHKFNFKLAALVKTYYVQKF